VPVHFRLAPGITFADVVVQARDALLDVMANGAVSFEDIVDRVGHNGTDWRVPLFRHVVNVHAGRLPEAMAGIPVRDFRLYRRYSRTDLELSVESSWREGELQALFSTEVHDEADVTALLGRFETFVGVVENDPHVRLADVDVRSPQDRRVVMAVNDTAVPLPDRTLVDLFRERAAAGPDRAALVADGETWSYSRLATAADEIAHRLSRLGVGAGDLVAVVADRGPWLAASVLGIWTCGAAYLPVDAELPPGRMATMLEDVAGIVVPDGQPPSSMPPGMVGFVLVAAESDTPEVVRTPSSPPRGPSPESAAVVIYTSGSTGRPKGVVVGHEAMHNVVRHFADTLPFGADDRFLWSTTYAFDISALELLVPLVQGGCAVVAPDDVQHRPDRLLALIARERVTVVQATPTLWREIVTVPGADLTGLRVISGGESLTAALARRLLATGCRLLNAYGPTETTIWSATAEITEPVPDPPPVGRPIANTRIDIRDEHGRPCPPGTVGELHIGGAGLAHGYHRDPELTSERFGTVGGDRSYRTGDRAILRPDGTLVLRGRTDRQVKLHGHRIELGAIEAALESHDEVRSAAVVAADDALVAFVRVTGAEDPAERLWRHLRRVLPSYEIPSRIIPVDDFALTPNGKVDHQTMLARQNRSAPSRPAASSDPLVVGVLDIWRDVLGDPELPADANFFLNGGQGPRW
jgi:amino acid adenylation domain-containing protein